MSQFANMMIIDMAGRDPVKLEESLDSTEGHMPPIEVPFQATGSVGVSNLCRQVLHIENWEN